MPQWDLHLVLLALLRPLVSSDSVRPTDNQIDLKWQTLKTSFSPATAQKRSYLHAFNVAPAHIASGRGDADGESTVSLLLESGAFAKNQLPTQAPSWICVTGIDSLKLYAVKRILCLVRQPWLYLWGIVRQSSYIRSLPAETFSGPIFRSGASRWSRECNSTQMNPF